MLQTDPDPDGIASALALRTILKRNKQSAPIVSLGETRRPENLTMLRLLGIEIQAIDKEDLSGFDCVILLDTQPTHIGLSSPVDVVIDHHPISDAQSLKQIGFLDIRSHYGATSTILTEYMIISHHVPGRRLATALAYGIKTDTMSLNREVHEADLNAFVLVYPHLNHSLLRRIERPCLPRYFAKVLGQVLQNVSAKDNLFCACLGVVEREDMIPQIADFLLQFDNINWSICVGYTEENLSISVRNVGYVQNAGDVIKKAFGQLGQGGGHRTMAKYLINRDDWLKMFGTLNYQKVQDIILDKFAEVLGERDN
jgi:nanoRNase/pAp phosphatase (c-di-AMP/oligoRNAs hydrolase)